MEWHWHACWIDVRAGYIDADRPCVSDPCTTSVHLPRPLSVPHRSAVHGLVCTVEASKTPIFHELSVRLMCPILQATTTATNNGGRKPGRPASVPTRPVRAGEATRTCVTDPLIKGPTHLLAVVPGHLYAHWRMGPMGLGGSSAVCRRLVGCSADVIRSFKFFNATFHFGT
jgi:hypothetical protein